MQNQRPATPPGRAPEMSNNLPPFQEDKAHGISSLPLSPHVNGVTLKGLLEGCRLRPGPSRPPYQPRRTHWFLLASNQLRLVHLGWTRLHARPPVHPLIQPGLAKPPTVPQPKRWDKPRGCIAIQAVGADAQIMGRLANVHHFPNFRRCGCGFHRGSSRYWEAMYTTPPQPKETL